MPRARRAVGLASCLQISYLQLQLYRKYYSCTAYQVTSVPYVQLYTTIYLCVLRFVTVVGHRVASAHILIAQQLQLLHKRLPCV